MKSPSSSELQKIMSPTSSEINALKKRWGKIVNIHWDENPVLLGPEKIRYYRLTTMDSWDKDQYKTFGSYHASIWRFSRYCNKQGTKFLIRAQYDGLFEHSAMLRDTGIVFIGPVELDPAKFKSIDDLFVKVRRSTDWMDKLNERTADYENYHRRITSDRACP